MRYNTSILEGNTFTVLHAYQKGTSAEHEQGELHEFESKFALSCGTHAQPGLVYVEGPAGQAVARLGRRARLGRARQGPRGRDE